MANAKTDIEHLNWLLTIFNQYGIYTDEINAISYAGIIAHTLTDSNAQITYKSNQAIKESHVITANKMDSLYKHAKEAEIMPTFSKPAAMKMILVISEKNFMMEAKGNGDIRYYTISKDNFVKVGNFIYSLDYDIELRLETLINGEKIATSRYVIDDVLTNPISIVDNTPSIRTIRVKTEDSWEYQLYVTLQQYHREFEEDTFGNRDYAVFNFRTARPTDELAAIDVFRIPSSESLVAEPIRLRQSMYFENSRKSIDTIFIHYVSANSFSLIHKSAEGGFRPLANDIIQCQKYITTGERGNFTFSTMASQTIKFVINNEASKLPIRVVLETGISFGGGSYGLEKEVLRKEIITKKATRDSIVIENDLYMILNNRETINEFAIIKNRNDIKKVFNIYTCLKFKDNSVTYTIPTNTLDIEMSLKPEDDTCIKIDDDVYLLTSNCVKSSQPRIGTIIPESDVPNAVPNVDLVYWSPFIVNYDKKHNMVRVYDAYINDKNKTIPELYYNNLSYSFICNWVKFVKDEYDQPFKITFEVRTNLANAYPQETLCSIDTTTTPSTITDTGFLEVYVTLFDKNKNQVYSAQAIMMEYVDDEETQDDYWRYDILLVKPTDLTKISRGKMQIFNPSDNQYYWVPVEDLTGEVTIAMPIERDPVTNLYNPAAPKQIVNRFTFDCKLAGDRSSDHKIQHSVMGIGDRIKLFNFPVVEYNFYKDNYERYRDALQGEYDYVKTTIDKYQGEFSYSIKYMNTYGYSATYTIGFDKNLLNNVTLDMFFTVERKLGSTLNEDDLSRALYKFISSIKFMDYDKLHMSKLYDYIYALYPYDINLIQFRGLNGIKETEQLIDMNISAIDNKTVVEKLNLPILYDKETNTFKYKATWNFINT